MTCGASQVPLPPAIARFRSVLTSLPVRQFGRTGPAPLTDTKANKALDRADHQCEVPDASRALLDALIASTEAAGIWSIQSSIFPANTASLALHARAGFRIIGTRERIGRHHGTRRARHPRRTPEPRQAPAGASLMDDRQKSWSYTTVTGAWSDQRSAWVAARST